MNLSPTEEKRIRKQFDCYVKKVLRGEANSYLKEIAARAKREINFSELPDAELEKLLAIDDHQNDDEHYNVNGFDIAVQNYLLIEALNALPDCNRNAILLAYFLEMSDSEIAAVLKNNRKTIYHNRINGFEMLKKILKEEPEND